MGPKTIIAIVAVALGLSLAALFTVRFTGPHRASSAESIAHQATKRNLEPKWPTPEFSYRDQHGTLTTPQTLRGEVWVANFIFTQCRTVCPMMTAKMVQLQRRLAGVKVRFVSFSVDPAHDTPEVLAAYAKKWAPEETRWTLLATDEATLQRTAAAFRITASKGTDDVDPIIHSAVFLLVDQDGLVRGAFDSEDREDFTGLELGVRALTGEKTKEAAELPTSGDALYHALSCAGCHERRELAPPLRGIAGQKREITTGMLATVDAAYVEESIVNPEAKRVRGYPLHMPSYDGHLDGERLHTLVAWLLARPATEEATDAGEASVAEDPVCHMQVRVADDALHAEHAGHTYYFCSEFCRERFVANPAAYTPNSHP